jgi:hypothetical protein
MQNAWKNRALTETETASLVSALEEIIVDVEKETSWSKTVLKTSIPK